LGEPALHRYPPFTYSFDNTFRHCTVSSIFVNMSAMFVAVSSQPTLTHFAVDASLTVCISHYVSCLVVLQLLKHCSRHSHCPQVHLSALQLVFPTSVACTSMPLSVRWQSSLRRILSQMLTTHMCSVSWRTSLLEHCSSI
jgi:hypothetical protein